jgi:hypothetical protein
MSRLNLSLRPAKVGNQMRANGELHGKDSVSALYFAISGVMLTKEELNIFANDETFWMRHFNGTPDRIPEVLDEKDFDTTIHFKHRLEGAVVRVVYPNGLEEHEITFHACRLAKIKLYRHAGGLTEFTTEVQTVPSLDVDLADFLGQINHEVQIEIKLAELSAKDAQRDLPLSTEPPKDVTRIIDPAQQKLEDETQRQLGEALRHHESQQQETQAAA